MSVILSVLSEKSVEKVLALRKGAAFSRADEAPLKIGTSAPGDKISSPPRYRRYSTKFRLNGTRVDRYARECRAERISKISFKPWRMCFKSPGAPAGKGNAVCFLSPLISSRNCERAPAMVKPSS